MKSEDVEPKEALLQAAPTSEVNSQLVERSRSLIWTIKNFSGLKTNEHYSEVFVAGGCNWRLLIFPRGNNVDHLSIYLDVADSGHLSIGWCRNAHFEISVVNQAHSKDTILKTATHQFNARESDFGFKSFIHLKKLHDPSKGFIVNDTIVIDVVVTVSQYVAPSVISHGKEKIISSHESIMPEAKRKGKGRGRKRRGKGRGRKRKGKRPEAKIVKNELERADSKPSLDTHTVVASAEVTVPADDKLNDLKPMSCGNENTVCSSESIMPTIPAQQRLKTVNTKIVENEPVRVESKPSSDTHTITASLGVTIPADDELNDLNFSDEESSHTTVAPARSIDDLPHLSKKVDAARDLILFILNKKSLYTIAEDLQLFTDALKTIKVAVPPAQAERVEKMLKVSSESAHQLEIANKRFHEAKVILDEHEDLEVAVKTDIDVVRRMKSDQQLKTKHANKLVSDIVAKEAELVKLKQELSTMGDINKGNEAVRKAYDDFLNKKEALKVQSAKVADAEAKKKAAGEEANKVLQEWEAYVQENVEFI